ncbi:pyroglutamyl-peptidase I [Erysipelothrix piscisicarius]|uniref:pyroglutamyl-peptidase I n=1 Tax=Erysipelothrix piscisicarius TaxID=2485784 RepID=UPI0039DF6D1C
MNPAYEAVKLLPDTIEGAEVLKLEVPTVFNKSVEVLDEAMAKHQPDIVICVGQAGNRFGVRPERVAINQDDARIKDNEGNQPIDETIFEDGKAAYFATLPIKAMVENMKQASIPASVSNTAGTFVCNHLMYGLLFILLIKNILMFVVDLFEMSLSLPLVQGTHDKPQNPIHRLDFYNLHGVLFQNTPGYHKHALMEFQFQSLRVLSDLPV